MFSSIPPVAGKDEERNNKSSSVSKGERIFAQELAELIESVLN